MAEFARIRRLHRAPLRIGSVNISNAHVGSLVNLSDPKVRRDLKNSYDRWAFIDRDIAFVAANATQVEANMSPQDIVTDQAAAATFLGTGTGGKEYATVFNLPAGFPVTNVNFTIGATGATGATAHGWATVATYDGTTNLTYQSVSADLTSGTIAANSVLTFNPVVSGTTVYVTPYEGQYIITFTLTVATTVPSFVGNTIATGFAATNGLAGPIPQNLNTYGNPTTNALLNPWASAQGGSVTTPPAVAATNAASNFSAAGAVAGKFLPFITLS